MAHSADGKMITCTLAKMHVQLLGILGLFFASSVTSQSIWACFPFQSMMMTNELHSHLRGMVLQAANIATQLANAGQDLWLQTGSVQLALHTTMVQHDIDKLLLEMGNMSFEPSADSELTIQAVSSS